MNILDTVDGDHIRGEGVTVEHGILVWRTAYGDLVRVPLDQVHSAKLTGRWDLTFGDGQTLRGSWSVMDGAVVFESPIFGPLRCPVGQLKTALPAISARGLRGETAAASPATIAPIPTASTTGTVVPPTDPSSEPPPSSLQTLLRQSSILLRPKEWSLSEGFNYGHNRTLYSPNDYRQLSLISQLQYGLTPKMEVGIECPVSLTRTSITTTAPGGTFATIESSKLRAGDPELSAARMLFSEGRVRPECVGVGGLTIPVNSASSGSVFRSRAGFEFLKTSDPGALFCGFAWLHDDDGWGESPYRPVERYTYHVGAAIGLNDELAVGFQAQGIFISKIRARNGAVLATTQEPVQGRFWFNFRADQRTFVEASVLLPMSSDSHTVTLGFSYIQRY